MMLRVVASMNFHVLLYAHVRRHRRRLILKNRLNPLFLLNNVASFAAVMMELAAVAVAAAPALDDFLMVMIPFSFHT